MLMPIERKIIPLDDPCAAAGCSRIGGSKMAILEQKRFASMVRLLQTAHPNAWEKHLHNLGVTASANTPPANLERIIERVFWMVRQAGIKDPAAWIAFDMDRAEAASASVEPKAPLKVSLPVAVHQNLVELEQVKLGTDPAKTSGASSPSSEIALASLQPEAPLKITLPVAVRQDPVELKPVRLGTDVAKTTGASPPASETGIKNPAAWIAFDMAWVEAAPASVKPEAPVKVALPVAVRQNPVASPVKSGTALAKTCGASPPELETAIVIARLLSQAKLAIEADRPREAAAAMYVAHEIHRASQQKIAAAVGKSQAWVSCMIRWRREGFEDTPFGPASKEERMWARFRRRTGIRMPRKILLSRWRNPHLNPGGRG
jgi:hypothetical protein